MFPDLLLITGGVKILSLTLKQISKWGAVGGGENFLVEWIDLLIQFVWIPSVLRMRDVVFQSQRG